MSILHAKSITIADWTGTVTVGNSAGSSMTVAASDVELPSDWNSAHRMGYTLGGNTVLGSTVSGTDIQMHGSGAISVGGTVNGASASFVISSPVMSTFEPIPNVGMSTNSVGVNTTTSGQVSLWPFVINHPLSAGVLDLMMSASFSTLGTSSGRQTQGLAVGLYKRGEGASSTRLESIVSTAIEYRVTGNNSSYTIQQPVSTSYSGYSTNTTASAGVNITGNYTGVKKMGVPINSYLSPGQYWLGMLATGSTSSINVGISFSYMGAVIATQATAMAPMGSVTSGFSTGSDPNGGRWREGHGMWSSAGSVTGLPASINMASISANNISVQPHMRLWRT